MCLIAITLTTRKTFFRSNDFLLTRLYINESHAKSKSHTKLIKKNVHVFNQYVVKK